MNKNTALTRSEKGQSIVLIAVVMLGLLALAGLAIDGGNLFWQRRNMQNAADAAALAGTRLLARAICGKPEATDAAIAGEVNRYAELNGVDDLSGLTATYVNINEAVLGQVGAGSVPVGATGIAVMIENGIPTYFLKVVGIDTADVSAFALAMTGPVIFAGGLRPIGVPVQMDLTEGAELTFDFGNCPGPECIVNYTGGQVQHRGWLNLAYVWNGGTFPDADNPPWRRAVDPNADANVLKDWMENGWSGPELYIDDYIHAKPGQSSSVIGETPPVGEILTLPIFDEVKHYDEIGAPKAPAAEQGGGYYYHIVGFINFRVTGANQGAGIITGDLVYNTIGTGQVSSAEAMGYGQPNACQTRTQAVNLWR